MSSLRRVVAVVALVLAVMTMAASCTAQQVQLFWQASGRGHISVEDATRVAYLLNVWSARNRIPYEANWDRVAACESGGRWSLSTGNGYYGGLQFSLSTWRAYGGAGYPHQNTKAEQIRIAERVRTQSGLGHWPHCGSRWYG